LAKNKKRRSSLKSTLKFEVYGILILIFSAIALSDEATVGRSLAKICGYVLGDFYFVIPAVFIYIGLYVMIKRSWPRSWSYRFSGILLLVLGIGIFSSISPIEQKLGPLGEYSAQQIIKQTNSNLNEQLISAGTDKHIFKKELGGGVIGGYLHAVVYFLFGKSGSKLIVFTMLIIGFMLITGISYVDILRFVKNRLKRYFKRLENKWGEVKRLLMIKMKGHPLSASRMQSAKPFTSSGSLPIEDEIDEENYFPERDKRKKPSLLFQMFPALKPDPANEGRYQEDDNEHTAEAALEKGSIGDPSIHTNSKHAAVPLIRDFQDHVERDQPVNIQSVQTDASPSADEVEDIQLETALGQIEKQSVAPYQLPPFHLLAKPASLGKNGQHMDYKANARKLETTLESFGVRAKVLEVVRGPAVTRYEIQPDVGVKVSRIVSLTDDIALALAAKDIRMEAPIPGKAAIGIEVPNTEVSVVTMREVMESSSFHESASKLSIVLGRDISGQPIVGNLARMPHLLVAGATGSGKSVCINGIITSILYKAKPDEVKFLMIDPKMVELNVYNGIPHLLAPVVTDPRRASLALKKVVSEMEKRYELFSKSGTRNMEGYNAMMVEQQGEPLPFIVVIVDELADLMMVAAGDVEDAICRLAQMARAAGIHLIIATQRPSVDVITGVIKANIPSRIAFGVSSQVDSRTILDMAGAEKLLGRGDMLFLPVGASKPVRVQGAFLSDPEVEAVVNFVRTQEKAEYKEEMVPEIEEQGEASDVFVDELFDQAVQIVLESKQASVSLLQRRMRVGYTRAARLIDSMEAKGIVGPYEGSKPRDVLVTAEQYQQSRIS
jgi:S-DNA-T family DNA segregation ATPase FtsK/SpoIIIE